MKQHIEMNTVGLERCTIWKKMLKDRCASGYRASMKEKGMHSARHSRTYSWRPTQNQFALVINTICCYLPSQYSQLLTRRMMGYLLRDVSQPAVAWVFGRFRPRRVAVSLPSTRLPRTVKCFPDNRIVWLFWITALQIEYGQIVLSFAWLCLETYNVNARLFV